MKILLLAPIYEFGGVSNVIKNILNNLDKKAFHIVFLVEKLASRHYPVREDIKFINLDIKPAKGWLRKLFNILRHLCQIRKVVINERPDIVISFTFPMSCLYLLAFLWPVKKRPKLILSEHTEQLFVRLQPKSLKEVIFKCIYKTVIFLLYNRADAIVPVSNSLATRIKKFFLIDENRIRVIHVPVNIEEIQVLSREKLPDYQDINDKPCIVTLSKLTVAKGINYLIEAFYDLLKKIDARLIIVGDGDEKLNLEEMVRNLKIDDKVYFLGWLENPYSYLRKMDIFVLPSLYEGFPNVIIESAICNVPVIATRSAGGIEELISDGVDGLLVPPKDPKALTDSIYRLLQDKELKQRLTRNALEKIRRFESARITGEYESLMKIL